MALTVKNNMPAQKTLNVLVKTEGTAAKDLKKLASGQKINSAGDDASGYAISDRMDVQVRGLDQDNDNTQNAQSLLGTAEGAVQSTVDILRTLKEKVINAANDTNTDIDRATIQKELDQAADQIDDNANVTFNGITLMDGSHNSAVTGEYGTGTYTCLTNTSLSVDTTIDTPITDLKDRTGNSLEIQTSDKITISYVKQGITHVSKPVTVGDSAITWNLFADFSNEARNDIDVLDPSSVDWDGDGIGDEGYDYIGIDKSGNKVYTTDRQPGITYYARHPGTDGQISGLTITITDRYGNPNKYANASLNNFQETIRAEDPSPDNSMVFQTGTKANQSVKVAFTDMRATALGLRATDGTTLQIGTQASANAAINVLDNALQKALNQQTDIGSANSRMDYTSANITTAQENTTAAMSTIRDADMAAEMTAYTKDNVIAQASQSMLAQANQNLSQVLSLLQ